MTLPLSGPISASDINLELGRALDAPFSLGGTEERALAGVPSGSIKFSDFYGKSNIKAVLTYHDTQVFTNNSTSYTTSNISLGAGAAGRIVIIGIAYDKSNTANIQISGANAIGANPMDKVAAAFTGTGATAGVGIYQLPYELDTFNVTVGFTATVNNCAVTIWTLEGQTSDVASFDTATSLSGTTLVTDVSGVAGISILTLGNTDNRTATWTGMTEIIDAPIETGEATYSAATAEGNSGNLQVTSTPSGTVARQSLVTAVWT